MRAFIVLELHDETKSYIKRIGDELARYAKGNFISDMNVHLTMSFLGEITPNELEKAREAISETCREAVMCDISLQRLLTFQRGDLIAVSVKVNEALNALYKKLLLELNQRGFVFENSLFKPHITLVRQAQYEMPFREIAKCVPVFNRPQTAGVLALCLSEVRSGVRVYDKMFSARLREQV